MVGMAAGSVLGHILCCLLHTEQWRQSTEEGREEQLSPKYQNELYSLKENLQVFLCNCLRAMWFWWYMDSWLHTCS